MEIIFMKNIMTVLVEEKTKLQEMFCYDYEML